MDRVRARVKDKRVLALVKSFLKAGVLTETRRHEGSFTGTPQGGILSPLLANIALSALDEHAHGPWLAGGVMSTPSRRAWRRAKGLPNWIPNPWTLPNHAQRQEPWRARCREIGTAGSASGLGKRTGSNPDTAPQADSTTPDTK